MKQKDQVFIRFDYGRCMLVDSVTGEAIDNDEVTKVEFVRLIMNTLCDLYAAAMKRGRAEPDEKAIFQKMFAVSEPVIRKEIANNFNLIGIELPKIFED